MKYPQAYVFLKSSIENDEDSIRRTIGAKVEVHLNLCADSATDQIGRAHV